MIPLMLYALVVGFGLGFGVGAGPKSREDVKACAVEEIHVNKNVTAAEAVMRCR